MKKNQKVTLTGKGRTRRLAADFPGWGDPNYGDYFVDDNAAGLAGVITAVESHGNAPYTRYNVRFEDGTRASGLAPHTDIVPA